MLVLNLTLKDFIKRESRGRKPKFPPEKEEDFKIELDNMQVSFKGGPITAKNIQPLLTDKNRFRTTLEVWWQDKSRIGCQASLTK